jgi:predicted Zn-dependent protease
MESLSKKINKVIKKYEWRTGVALTFGEVLYDLEHTYSLKYCTEEECIEALEDMVDEYIKDGFYVEKVEV